MLPSQVSCARILQVPTPLGMLSGLAQLRTVDLRGVHDEANLGYCPTPSARPCATSLRSPRRSSGDPSPPRSLLTSTEWVLEVSIASHCHATAKVVGAFR